MFSKILVACIVLGVVVGYEQRPSRSLISALSYTQPGQGNRFPAAHYGRVRRQTPPFPKSSGSNDRFIPRIEPPPSGSILTYDGKPISTSIGAYNIVPKSERRTPSINLNRPQYATYRGDLPPPIPDVVPRDFPQFKNSRSLVPNNLPPGFQNN